MHRRCPAHARSNEAPARAQVKLDALHAELESHYAALAGRLDDVHHNLHFSIQVRTCADRRLDGCLRA
jgi:hypothetical protein